MNDLNPHHNPPPRIGLFGGTFNPIHRGHLQVATDVLKQFHLDRICFMPCALPPHKTEGNLAPATDRLEMVRIAIEKQPTFQASDLEIRRSGPSYTIDTLRELTASIETDANYFFLVGVDAFLEIHTWKAYRQLFNLAAFIVMTRPDSGERPLNLTAQTYAHRHICDGYTLDIDGRSMKHPDLNPIYLATVSPAAIASTQIRDMIRSGHSIHQWVDSGVSEYIENKGLYL